MDAPGNYMFENIPPGSYYVRAFMDANGIHDQPDGIINHGDPQGAFGGLLNPTALEVTAGNDQSDVDISLEEGFMDVISSNLESPLVG